MRMDWHIHGLNEVKEVGRGTSSGKISERMDGEVDDQEKKKLTADAETPGHRGLGIESYH